MQCWKFTQVHRSEADNFRGGLGTFCWFFFNFMFKIWDSWHEDLQFFWLSFKHWAYGQHWWLAAVFNLVLEGRTHWGPYEASQWHYRVSQTKWIWFEIDKFLSILPNWIEWKKSMYNIISLCTSVNFFVICLWLVLLNKSTYDDFFILSALKITLINWSIKVCFHCSGVIMCTMASQIISLTIVYSSVYSGADWRKYKCSVSLVLGGEFTGHWWIPGHKGPVTWKMFPIHDVIMSDTWFGLVYDWPSVWHQTITRTNANL